MKRAYVNIKPDPHYRRQAFVTGLQRHGYKIVDRIERPEAGDLFVSWNLHGDRETTAEQYRRAGAKVLVCENGVIGKDENGVQLYSIARDAHHAGTWHVGDYSRWERLGIPVLPWVERSGYALICGQRGIGARRMASPSNWHAETARELERRKIPHKIRLHPGWKGVADQTPLEKELAGASVCVVWSSMSGVRALTLGIPVAYYAPAWVGWRAALQGIDGVLRPKRDDHARKLALTEVAWYQWRTAEIEAGLPFEVLL